MPDGDFVWGGWRKPYQYILGEAEDKYATFFKGMVAPMKLNKGKKYKLGDILVTIKSSGELFRSGDYSHYGVSYQVEFPHPRNARNTIQGYLSMAPNGGFRLNVGGVVIIRAESGGFGMAQKTSEYDWFLNHYRGSMGESVEVTEDLSSGESVEVSEATIDKDRISRKIAAIVQEFADALFCGMGDHCDLPHMQAYSGRGMYGKYCLGVSVGRYQMDSLLKEFKRKGIPEPWKDTLGMGAILYWQNIPHDPKIHINHHVKDESVDHGVDALVEAKRQPEAIYFSSYTAALNAARAKAEREGYAIDENDWNTRVTHGYPGRPAEGETTNVKIGLSRVGKGGKPEAAVLVIAVYGMKQSFELTSYISKVPMGKSPKRVGESVEVTEVYNTIQVHPAYRDDDKGWYITHTDAKGGNQVWGPFASITEAKKAARKYAERYGATMKEESEVGIEEAKLSIKSMEAETFEMLRAVFAKWQREGKQFDPDSPAMKALLDFLDAAPKGFLQKLAKANIGFFSDFAKNRLRQTG